MEKYELVNASYIKEAEIFSFNLVGVPFEVLGPLMAALRVELSNRSSLLTAASFKEERHKQHIRHLEDCKKRGTIPQQQFIDFPLN